MLMNTPSRAVTPASPMIISPMITSNKPHRRASSMSTGRNRRGATAVEFAMVAPIVFMLLFGALELSHANMVLNTAEAAAYEGARIGIVPGANAADCQAAAKRILDLCKIENATITVVPAVIDNATQTVTINIDVPYNSNAVTVPVFTQQLRIQRSCKLSRERS